MLINPKTVEPTVQRAIHFNRGVYDKLLEIKEATGKSITIQVNEALEQVLGGNADGSDADTKKSVGRSRRTRISTKA